MRRLSLFFICLTILALVAGSSLAQTSGSTTTTTTTTTKTKKRRAATAKTGTAKSEVQVLREQLQQQQQQYEQERQQRDQQMNQLQQQLQQVQQQLQQTQTTANDTASKVDQVSTQAQNITQVQSDVKDIKSTLTNQALNIQEEQKKSNLSFRIGNVDFTPAGFLDFTNIWRSENTGAVVSSNFGSFPYSNQVQGHLTEYRVTGQHSRVSLKAHSNWHNTDLTGYIEADFNGNDAATVFVGTNPHTFRLRHYYLDAKHGKWEFLGGQTWGWLTDNKTGIGTDAFLTPVYDPNYNVGLTVTRQGQFRAIYHFTDHFAWGVDIENPQQYVGAGEVLFPFAFNAQLGGQFDTNGAGNGAPNLSPDFVSKLAYDAKPMGHAFHIEAAGVAHPVKITFLPVVPPTAVATFQSATAMGSGIHGALNYQVINHYLMAYASGFYGDGVGRQQLGLGPDAVVNVIHTAPGNNFIAEPSLVHSGSGLVGFSATVTPRNEIYAQYGGAYFQRNAFPDSSNPATVAAVSCATGQPAQTKGCIGFGGTNSANSANRAIQEPTLGWNFTMWKDPNYGALALLTQYSYVTRAPWFVPAGAPKNAHYSFVFVDLRYTLP